MMSSVTDQEINIIIGEFKGRIPHGYPPSYALPYVYHKFCLSPSFEDFYLITLCSEVRVMSHDNDVMFCSCTLQDVHNIKYIMLPFIQKSYTVYSYIVYVLLAIYTSTYMCFVDGQ